jgi:prolyl-tRNA synthetase
MRMSNLFVRTLRESPADAETVSHQLLVRAGFIQQLGAGVYSILPLAQRAIDKIENIMRDEINAIGGQELKMPVVNPADIWKETNRYYEIGSEMSRFQDRKGGDMVLAMTHEEVVADLTRKIVQSYRQLPMLVYHIQTKWRDDPRPRAGLIRVREFTMKDSYSLDADEAGLDKQYRAHYQSYYNIFNRCGIPVVSVLSDVGMMGGSMAHEYMYLTPIGEDTLIMCDECGYMANRQVALFEKPTPPEEEVLPMEKVETPEMKTIADLAKFLGVPESKTAKMVFMVGTFVEGQEEVEKIIFAAVRGDMELNETKLANALKAKELRPAHEEEIEACGAVPGYASPIGVEGVIVIVDELVANSKNLVSGANEEGYHLLNVNVGRDYEAQFVADIVSAEEGYTCVQCGSELKESRGVEVGNIFKLGTKYTEALGATYLDKDGKARPVIMGSYGIGSGRLLACIVEEHNDEYGIIWPISVAPYHIHIVSLRGVEEEAEAIYSSLEEAGYEVLFDDRNESPGVKFNDADLIGVPVRITVGARSLKDGNVELKLRGEDEKKLIPVNDLVDEVGKILDGLWVSIEETVVEVPFKAE